MNKKVATRSVMNGILLDYKTKAAKAYMNYANVVTTDYTGDVVYAYGSDGHVKKVSFHGEKGGSVKIETQIKPFELYQIMMGGTVASSQILIKREVLTSADATGTFKITLSETPAANAYLNVFKEADDCGTALTVTITEKVVSLPASETAAGKYVAYYMYSKTGASVKALKITNQTKPGLFVFQGDTYNIAEDGTVENFYAYYYKLSPKQEISLAYSNTGDPMTLTLEFEMLQDVNGDMYALVAEEVAN